MRGKVIKNFITKNCLKFGHFTLQSGQTSDFYVDKFILESDPNILFETGRLMVQKLPKLRYDYVVGLELGGIPIATVISQITKKPLVLLRKSAKDYGTNRMAEGPDIQGKNLLMIEDIVTTGGQIIESYNRLKESGGNTILVSAIILREEEAASNIKQQTGLDLSYAFEYKELFT